MAGQELQQGKCFWRERDDFIAGARGVSAWGVMFECGGAGGKNCEKENRQEFEKIFELLLLHWG